MIRLRLFVSSPSDVQAERVRVDAVTARLNSELDGVAEIETVRWETGFYTAERSFQQAIDAAIDNMRGIDMAVCVLWKRVGSELNPQLWRRPDGSSYESGTVLEVETAVELGRQQGGVPDVYLFRKRAPIITYAAESFEAERMQHQVLETVWRRWTETEQGHNAAGYQRFDDPDDFERQLELCLRQWLERRGVVVKTVWDRQLKGSPFRGLSAFEAEHAQVFFGREAAIARALAKLRQAEAGVTPFLTVVGASGAGKSSLLRAGLMPRVIQPGVIPGIDLWRAALVVPAGDPLASLAEALFAESALGSELRVGDFRSPELLARCFASGAEMALPPIQAAVERAAKQRAKSMRHAEPRPARLLTAVDQIERVFVEAEPGLADRFAEILRALVEQRLATVIVALRSDAYASFQQVPAFAALLEREGTTYNLLPPSEHELEDIVLRPVAACHPPLVFETMPTGHSLAETLVADTKGGDALPLLQLTLQRLFDAEARRGDGVLRGADYPGIDEAVARTAAEALATLDPAAAGELPALLTALVGDVTQDAVAGVLPIIVPLDRMAFERALPARRALVDAFIAYRLLTAEYTGGRNRVRPTHDALLRTWPEAVRIIADNAALIRVRHTIEPIAADWEIAPAAAKPGYLATSAALVAGAETLATRFGEDLTPVMRGFIAASLAADAARRNAERRRQRRVLTATAAGLVVAVSLAGLAGWQWRVAVAQRASAQHSLALATQTANGLVFSLAQKFRDSGVPVPVIADILARARQLQDELTASGEISPQLRRSQAAALDETAETLLAAGDTKGALAAATQERDVVQALLAAAPGNTEWQRGLSLSEDRIGDVLRAQGSLPGALEVYRDSLATRKVLAAKDPGNARAQRDLSLSDDSIGEVLVAQGDLAGALGVYRESLAIRKALAATDPGNSMWQRDLAISDAKIGEVLQAQGNFAAALASHLDSRTIAKALAEKDPGNTDWQRGLVVSNAEVGDALIAWGALPGALAAYRDSLAIAKGLAQKDPGNTQWQRDVSIDDERIGAVLFAQGDGPGALAADRDGLATMKALATKDPGNSFWQHDLLLDNERLGDVLRAQDDLAGALAAFRDGLAIGKALAAKDPSNSGWQRDLSVGDNRVGDIELAMGDATSALAANEDALTIQRRLYAAAPNPTTKADLVSGLGSLAFALLFGHHPQEALDRAQEAAALDPSALRVAADRADALLFLGRFDEAKAIYLADKDKKIGKGTFADAVRDDFAQFRKYGIDTPDMKRIEALLAT